MRPFNREMWWTSCIGLFVVANQFALAELWKFALMVACISLGSGIVAAWWKDK